MKEMLLIYNAHLVDKNIDVKNGAILLSGSRIEGFVAKAVVNKLLKDPKITPFDAHGCVVMPSFIDMHVHMRDPGLTQKEDIDSGCHAAAAGGFGTVVLMPNTNPVVSSQELAELNNNKAKELGLCQVIQSVSITKDFDGKTISHLLNLNSKKVPVITEDGHEVTDSNVMLEAMKVAAKQNIIVSCHSEDPFLALAAKPWRQKALASKTKAEAAKNFAKANELLELAEDTASYRNIALADKAGCHVHLCHVSTMGSIQAVREAKKAGINVTCEVTPHHLCLSTQDKSNLLQIVNPPIRSEEDRRAIVEALKDGTADVIATDHAPHTMADKEGGSPGFSGLETAFASCYTTLVKDGELSLCELSGAMSARPAELLGIKNKGLLEEGYEADLVIIDTEKQWTVHGEDFASKGKYSALEGKKLYGEVKYTFYNGELVFQA